MIDSPATDSAGQFALRLKRLRRDKGWNMQQLAAAAGMSRTTLHHLEQGTVAQPRVSTLHKLASALEVSIDAFDVPAESSLAHDDLAARRAFDRRTNVTVASVAAQEPALFEHWSADDWDELYSQFGAGGALNDEGVRTTAARINRNRETLERLRVLLQTHLAQVAANLVDSLYDAVAVPVPAPRNTSTDSTQNPSAKTTPGEREQES
jgi:transcriptional regulator with XRE-family HTH domain